MRRILAASGIDGSEQEARRLVTSPAAASRTADEVLDFARRRAAGEPLQYITGVAGFRYLELAVGSGVFIPRPETEVVVEAAMSFLPRGGTAVDVGTGSGAIAIAIATERPDASVHATEVSPEAMAWARLNREASGAPVKLFLCDLLEGLPPSLRGRIDVVVSNPPYIAEDERETLPADVLREPSQALFAGGDGGAVLERLAQESTAWLRSGGWLVTEIGAAQGGSARSILSTAGYHDVEIRRDLAGRDRVAVGRTA